MKARNARQERHDYRALSGKALLDDMEQYRKEVTATPETARETLRRIGVLDKNGKLKRLICG